MKKLVIFGAGEIAQLAHFYFTHDSEFEVAGFTVDAQYLKASEFCGRPVVSFDQVAKHFPPSEYAMFVAVSYAKLNQVRKEKFFAAKEMGYNLVSYISSKATVFPGFEHGENCFVLEDNTIQPFATLGDNVTLWSGNHIGHHSRIESHNFLASHIVISGGVVIQEQCFIGVNVTLRDHVTIGAKCVLGAGAVILGDTEAEGVYVATATERSKVPSSRLRQI